MKFHDRTDINVHMYIVFPYELSLRDYILHLFSSEGVSPKELVKIFLCELPEVPSKGSGALVWAGGQQSRGTRARVAHHGPDQPRM